MTGGLLDMAPARILPHRVVEAVVEIEMHEVLELAARRREQLLADPDMVVHRPADIEEQQELHRVVPLRHHLQIEPAGIVRGRADRAGQVEFQFGALAGELAQAAQRQLDVAGAEFDRVVEVAEFALVPDLDRGAVALRFRRRCARPRGCSRNCRTARCRRCRSIYCRPGGAPSARRGAGATSPSACPSRRAPRSVLFPPRSDSARRAASAIPRAVRSAGRSASRCP